VVRYDTVRWRRSETGTGSFPPPEPEIPGTQLALRDLVKTAPMLAPLFGGPLVKLWLGSFAALALVASSAHAIYRPGWERPVLRAELQQLSGGTVINYHLKKSLTLNKADGSRKAATSYTLVEEQQVYCIQAPCPPIKRVRQFVIQSSRAVGCGSKKITAVEQAPVGLTDFPAATLTVLDHSARRCDDRQLYTWMITVGSKREAKRFFGGNPEPVYTIQ